MGAERTSVEVFEQSHLVSPSLVSDVHDGHRRNGRRQHQGGDGKKDEGPSVMIPAPTRLATFAESPTLDAADIWADWSVQSSQFELACLVITLETDRAGLFSAARKPPGGPASAGPFRFRRRHKFKLA
jgi:hypothetical protein